jgi:N-acetylglucosamine-6-phosphate deacetylase
MRDAVLLRNARIVLADSTTEPTSVLIEDGRIARVFDSSETAPPSSPVIDLNGLTLFPGFIDIHTHGAAGVDTMQASTDDLLKLASFLSRHGVTAWLPTLFITRARSSITNNAGRCIANIFGLSNKLAMLILFPRCHIPK